MNRLRYFNPHGTLGWFAVCGVSWLYLLFSLESMIRIVNKLAEMFLFDPIQNGKMYLMHQFTRVRRELHEASAFVWRFVALS